MSLRVAFTGMLMVAVWVLLAPAQLGGSVTYVSTYGNSMEPRIHSGDLVVTRPASSYGVGDSVAYQSATLDVTVLHRVVSGTATAFVTKGDNNDWLDPDTPSAEQILGAEWFRIPQGGIWLDRLTAPPVLFGLVLVAFLFGSAPQGRRQRGRDRRRLHGQSVR